MLWNKIFWVCFVLAEAVLLVLMFSVFSPEVVAAFMLVFLMGVAKLFDDVRARAGMGVRVRKDLLKKLK